MKIRTVLIWFVIAGLLAAAVAATRSGKSKPGSDAPRESWSIAIDPARARSVALTVDGRERSRVERAAAGIDRWILSRESGSWPADPERVRAALRLLATTPVSVSDEERGAATGDPMLRIAESDGSSVEITFETRAAGGQIGAVIDVRDAQNIVERRVVGRLPANIYDAIVRTDWGVWRDTALFDSVTATAKSLTIEAGPNRVRLERGARGWAITSPFALEADSDEVGRALGAIGSLQASSFIDAPPDDQSTGLDRPLATIAVATDTAEQHLALGRATDGAGSTIFARFRSGDSDATIAINPESVSKLTASPEAYARRIPLGVAAADIGQIRLSDPEGNERFSAERNAGDWLIGGTPATPDQRDAIERALRVLTLEPAGRVATRAIESDVDGALGEIRCFTAEGIPVASLSLRVGEELRLHIATPLNDSREIIWTSVSDNAKGVALWANAILRRG